MHIFVLFTIILYLIDIGHHMSSLIIIYTHRICLCSIYFLFLTVDGDIF